MSEKLQDTLPVDQELAQLAQKRHKADRILRVFIVFFVLTCAVVLLQMSLGISLSVYVYVVLLVPTFATAMYGGSLKQNVTNRQKEISISYTPIALREAMDHLDCYDRNQSVNQDYLQENLGFPDFTKISYTGDYVKGVLRGIPLEFSEFELEEARRVYDHDEDSYHTEYRSVFEGLIVVCRHGFCLDGSVTLCQFHKYSGSGIGKEAFDKSFSISADRSADISRVLTPGYTGRLTEIAQKHQGILSLRFRPDGTMLIVLKDWNLFEVNHTASTANLIEKIRGEITELGNILVWLDIPTGDKLEAIEAERAQWKQSRKEAGAEDTPSDFMNHFR